MADSLRTSNPAIVDFNPGRSHHGHLFKGNGGGNLKEGKSQSPRCGDAPRKNSSSAHRRRTALGDDERQVLLDEARLGRKDAHGDLLETYRGWMCGFFRRGLSARIARKVDADDLAQEACIHALAGFPRFCGERLAQYLAWLRKICQNLLAAVLRRFCGAEHDAAREQPLDEEFLEREREHGCGRRQPTREEVIARLDDLDMLAEALNGLPNDERLIVVWRQFKQQTFTEIAARLCWTRHAVERAFQRAFARLRITMKQASARNATG